MNLKPEFFKSGLKKNQDFMEDFMLKNWKWTMIAVIGAALVTGFCGGCDILNEALDPAFAENEDPNSEDYRPRFVVGIFSIVEYPRASELEKPVIGMDGKEVYININQNFSSKYMMDAKAVTRPGNPELCDLAFKLNRLGKVQWQLLAGRHQNEAVALVIDNKLVSRFIPELPKDEDADWVFLRVGIDQYHGKNVVKYAKKNYVHYNPDSGNFWKKF